MKRTLLLIILDGWGIGRNDESNAIYAAHPEHFRFLEQNYPVTSLHASGLSVGLPWGEVGNSEVGHLTLGAGKVLYQYFPRIILAIRDKSFFENEALTGAFSHARAQGGTVHLVGLLSNGNVHASMEHLEALVKMGDMEKVSINLHLFSDGKDCPPHTLEKLLTHIPREKLRSLTGRYYAMDREGNWQLTRRAYEAIMDERGDRAADPARDVDTLIRANYERGNSEEFLPPVVIGAGGSIHDNDAVIFLNYREDSIRQLAEAFLVPGFDKFPVHVPRNLWVTTFSQYEERFRVPVAFPPERIAMPLGAVLAREGKTQLRVAETYKYAHVTYFFNGYREEPFPNEYRVLIPSIATPRVDDQPQMMASAITDRLIQGIENQSFDFILANYANPDAIAHTGNFEAAHEAVRTVDYQIGRILKSIEGTPTLLVLTSDHGNAEELINPLTALPETQHDPNPVPLYLVGKEFLHQKFLNQEHLTEPLGSLSDVAPTVLALMDMDRPEEMTGQNLLRHLI